MTGTVPSQWGAAQPRRSGALLTTLRRYPLEKVLRDLLVSAFQRLDEDDPVVGLGTLGVEPLNADRHDVRQIAQVSVFW